MSEGTANPVIEISDLRKRYGSAEVLRGLDLQVGAGEVYGFLGRNGAGKSTTIRILMGITYCEGGEVRVFGHSLENSIRHRQRIGYVAQEQNFYPWMTPESIGRFVRSFYPTWKDERYAELIRNLEVPPRGKIRTFSGGMRAKLALALALAPDPHLLVLDEPTAGLDPVTRREFLELVRDQAVEQGRTTFFSTHLIDEIEIAAHRLAVVDAGRTRYEGSVPGLLARMRRLSCPHVGDEGASPVSVTPLPPRVARPEAPCRILRDRYREGRREIVVEVDDPDDFHGLFVDAPDWRVEALSLEDAFIEMVRHDLRTLAPQS